MRQRPWAVLLIYIVTFERHDILVKYHMLTILMSTCTRKCSTLTMDAPIALVATTATTIDICTAVAGPGWF